MYEEDVVLEADEQVSALVEEADAVEALGQLHLRQQHLVFSPHLDHAVSAATTNMCVVTC